MVKANVLVTAAGTIVAQGIIKCLKYANTKKDSPATYRIIATDMSPQAAGLYRSDLSVLVPPASSPEYIDFIVEICKEHDIKAIFVGSDEELMPIANAKRRLEKETGAIPITNPASVLVTALDKWKTFEFLKENDLPCPKSCLPEGQEELIRDVGFPLVVKPREGHGSLHFYIVRSRDEVKQAIASIQKTGWQPILQEYLGSEDAEFTSGVTVDKTGKRVMSSISMRRILKGGQTYKAFIDDFQYIRKFAEETALKIGSVGPINIQARLTGKEPKIFEINPRFSGTCPLRAVAGINEPDIVFRNVVMGEDIKKESYQKLVCIRYLNEVYVPYRTYEKLSSTRTIEDGGSFVADYF